MIIEDAARLETLMEERNELLRQMEARNEYAHQRQTPDFPEELLDDFAGRSEKAKAVKYMAYKASQSRFNVLLTGESGTGKTKLRQSDPSARQSAGAVCRGELYGDCAVAV